MSLSNHRNMELYQIRWSIEVLFRECKQYLRLGKAQNTDFCGQIADATLTMITYTILSLYKRFEAYETMGALFRNTQKEIMERTFSERIELVILKIIRELLEVLSIDIEQTMYRLTSIGNASPTIVKMLQSIYQSDNGSKTFINSA